MKELRKHETEQQETRIHETGNGIQTYASQPDGPLKGAGGYILDVIFRICFCFLKFGKLYTNVANGSIRILTLDIASRIYISRFG